MTTQDKPAVGPLGAGDVKLLVKGDLLSVRSYAEQVRLCRFLDSTDEPAPVLRVEQDGQTAPNCWGFHRFAFIGRPGPDGWILWSGGENPVPGQRVEVRFRSGVVRANHLSDAWTWTHGTNITDIIAFRLAPTAPVEAGGSEDLARTTVATDEVFRLTLCGSTKFRAEYELWNKRLTLAGFLVYSVSGFGHSGDTFTEEEKSRLDQIHLAKIDASHAIVVLNVGGYVGESTSREIAHAKAAGKPVYFLEGDNLVYRLRTGPDGPSSLRYRAFDWGSLAPTAPVEAGGSEDKRRREITAVMSALDRFEDLAGRVTATQAEHVLASLSALRHQPSGETREAVARIVDPEAFAVPIPDLRGIQVQRANERKAAALTKADDILALLRPAAPGGGEVILTNGNRLKPGGPLRKFQRIAKHDGHVWVKALNGNYEGELLTFRADTLSAIPASEGGEG